jgi:putative flippase GtrA
MIRPNAPRGGADASGSLSDEADNRAITAASRLRARSAELRRIAKFLAVGLLNTAVGYSLFYAALHATGHSIAAAAISNTLGALFNFLSVGGLVFGSFDHRPLKRFVAVCVAVFLVNSAGLALLERAGVPPALAQALLLPGLAAVSYRLNRDFVFAGPRLTDATA